MKFIGFRKIERLLIATALASGLVSAAVAASAQTTTAPAATTTKAQSVSMSVVHAKDKRQANLERENAEARRMLFRNQGTSL